MLGDSKIRKGMMLVVLIGLVSLFADFTYEGARSIIPQYFTSILGGSVFLLGIAIGVGDFLGYAFRLVSGKLADMTHAYWKLIFLGYAINLLAVPLLALSGNYLVAMALIFAERLGKATRTPARDYVISTAAEKGETGKAFAIHQLLDQTGAVVGPIVVSFILLYTNGAYRTAFAFLAIPAVVALATLVIAYKYHKRAPARRRIESSESILSFRKFLLYSVAIAINAAGLYQVAFIMYGAQSRIAAYLIPIIFLTAMVGEGAFGFIFGLLYDRAGRNLVYTGLILALIVPFLLIGGSITWLFAAALVFGAVTGIQDTVMRAVVGSLITRKERGFAYGIFNAFYGFGLMASGIVVGFLYYSIGSVMIYVVATQIVAFVVLAMSFRK